jgi:drug/metabolite transporter (DMT)-like permease
MGRDRSPIPAARSRDLGILALVLFAPICGYSWAAMKVALEYSPPLTYAALRLLLCAACLFLVMIVMRRSLRPPPLGYTLVIGILQTTAAGGLSILALQSGDAGRVAVLTYTMPFWLLLLAWGVLGERLRGVQWLAVILALAGLLLVVAPWQLLDVMSSVLTLLGGLAWAASAVVVKLMQREHHVDVLSLTTWQIALGALPLVVLALVMRSGGPQWTLGFVGSLAYTTVLATGGASLLWLYALRTLSAGPAGLGTLAVPVFGVVAAWLQLGEKPTGVEAFGMALIVGGLAVLAAQGITAGRGGLESTGRGAIAPPLSD